MIVSPINRGVAYSGYFGYKALTSMESNQKWKMTFGIIILNLGHPMAVQAL